MGSNSYGTECPKCGSGVFMVSQDTHIPYSSGECLDCGYTFYSKDDQMTLEEVNERRRDFDMDEITKLKRKEGRWGKNGNKG